MASPQVLESHSFPLGSCLWCRNPTFSEVLSQLSAVYFLQLSFHAGEDQGFLTYCQGGSLTQFALNCWMTALRLSFFLNAFAVFTNSHPNSQSWSLLYLFFLLSNTGDVAQGSASTFTLAILVKVLAVVPMCQGWMMLHLTRDRLLTARQPISDPTPESLPLSLVLKTVPYTNFLRSM